MSAQTTEATTVLPPADLEALLDIHRFLEHVTESAALLWPDGQTVMLPLPLEALPDPYEEGGVDARGEGDHGGSSRSVAHHAGGGGPPRHQPVDSLS